MRVSLFGLFLRGTNLMESWPKPVQSDLLVIGFIRFYRFYVNLGDIWCCHIYFTSRLFTCSYLIIPCIFSTGCHLLYPSCSCMHVLTNTVFYACLCLGFINTHVLIYARHLAFASPLAGESDSSRSSCPGFRACSEWILPVADLRSAG